MQITKMLTGNKIHNFNIDFQDPFRSPPPRLVFISKRCFPQYNKKKTQTTINLNFSLYRSHLSIHKFTRKKSESHFKVT
jgi:hypothetical protein